MPDSSRHCTYMEEPCKPFAREYHFKSKSESRGDNHIASEFYCYFSWLLFIMRMN